MAEELNTPGYLPMSKPGSTIALFAEAYNDGIVYNDGNVSGWTQLDGEQEVAEGATIVAFTQRDSPRIVGSVNVYIWSAYNTDNQLDSDKLYFQVTVQECSNGHKFWLGQTFTIVYTVNLGDDGEEDVTFTYELTDSNFSTTPALEPDPDYIDDQFEFYYGYSPEVAPYQYLSGGRFTSRIGNVINLSGTTGFQPVIKSIEATPNGFFQPPGE